jgi:hypothetical protein
VKSNKERYIMKLMSGRLFLSLAGTALALVSPIPPTLMRMALRNRWRSQGSGNSCTGKRYEIN